MPTRSIAALLLCLVCPAVAEAQTTLSVQWDWAGPAAAHPGVPVAEGVGALTRVQEAHVGWLDGEAAAEGRDVGTRRALGVVGGLVVGFFGLEAASQNNEPAFFGRAALYGATAVLLSAVSLGSPEPDAATMQEVDGRGEEYRRAFLDGYSSRLRKRRERAGLGGGALGFGIGAAVLLLLVATLCGSDC